MKSLSFLVFGLLFYLFLPTPIFAQIPVKSDSEYMRLEVPGAHYIYAIDRSPYLSELLTYSEYFLTHYRKSFKWTLDETPKIALLSAHNQIPNAFATVIPFTETVFFPTLGDQIDYFTGDSWIFVLASHEIAHLYQLNTKGTVSGWVKLVLGNTPVFTFVIPVFTHPNMFTPTFIVEGNATMNESLFGRGGRLFNAEVWAEVLKQIQAGEVYPERLINFNWQFPRREKYHQGGHFSAYLGHRFGVDHVNQFFLKQGKLSFFPFILNQTFREHYGASYTRLIYDYVESMRPLAEAQLSSTSPPLVKAFEVSPMNHNSEKIFFSVNFSGSGPTHIVVFDKKTKVFSFTAADLPLNKLFFLDDQRYYARGSYSYHPTKIQYSLYSDGFFPKKEYLSKIVYDIRGKRVLYVPAEQSSSQSPLFLNDQLLGPTSSSAILDTEGQAYYFRQSGQDRVLYKSQKALSSFRGYFSKPTEVSSAGELLFIAPTAFGSSLFSYSNNVFQRLFKSDTIIDARQIHEHEFLVVEVGASAYELKIVKAEPRSEAPFFLELGLPTTEGAPTLDLALNTSAPKGQTYRSPLELRRSFSNMSVGYGVFAIDSLFADPLMFNVFNIGGSYLDPIDAKDGPNYALSGTYSYLRHRLGFRIGGGYSRRAALDSNGERVAYDNNVVSIMGLNYPLFKWGHWGSEMGIDIGHEVDADYPKKPLERDFIQGQWSFNFLRTSPVGYEPYRRAQLSLANKHLGLSRGRKETDQVYALSGLVSGEVGDENYLSLSGQWSMAQHDNIDISYLRPIDIDPTSVQSRLGQGEVREVRQYSLGFKKAFHTPYYFARFPLSFLRLAPFSAFGETFTREKAGHRFPRWRQEWLVGLEAEFTLLHLVPIRMSLTNIYHSHSSRSAPKGWTPMILIEHKSNF